MLHHVYLLGEQVSGESGAEDVRASDTCFGVEELEPGRIRTSDDASLWRTLNLYHSSGMKPMRTLPGCSGRTGRSNPGDDDVPREMASAAGRWAKTTRKVDEAECWGGKST